MLPKTSAALELLIDEIADRVAARVITAIATAKEATKVTRPLMSPEGVAVLLGVSEQTLDKWRRNGSGPPWIKVGRRLVRYRREDVDAWAAGDLVERRCRRP